MKKSFVTLLMVTTLLVTTLVISCTKSDTTEPSPTAGLTKLTDGYAIGAAAKVEIYTSSAVINSGYTKFYISLLDSTTGNRIENANIQLMPMMDMVTMQHSSPYENPESDNTVNHLFPCSVVFTMPSTSGNWTIKIQVTNSGKVGLLTIPVTVVEPLKSRMKSFTALHDGGKYFITLIDPASPKVGINDMEIAIYKKASMMSFPADNSLSVALTPEMPTMGHGSPNNVNPVSMGKGHYKGKVNFTMTGLWKLNLDFMAGTAVADSTQFFEVEF